MHRVNCRGAGITRTRPRADQSLPVQRGSKPLVAHVTLDHRRDRFFKHDLDELPVVAEQLLQRGSIRRIADPRVVRLGPERPPDPCEELLVAGVPVGVSGAHRRHHLVIPLGVVPQAQGGAVVERTPEMRVDDMHSIAVPAQVELVDHPVVEETDEIRARAHHESRDPSNGCSSVHAPPMRSRASSTSTLRPARAR